MSTTLRAAIALAAIILPGSVLANTQVFGNGLAAQCSDLAIDGKFDKETVDLCTLALETEFLRREDTAKTYVNRGVVHMRRGSFALAGRDLQQAERLVPKLPEVYINRGALLIRQKRFEEAVKEIEKGLALNPDEPEKGYFNRAVAREGLDDVKGAYFDYLKASQLDPEWEPPKNELKRFSVAEK